MKILLNTLRDLVKLMIGLLLVAPLMVVLVVVLCAHFIDIEVFERSLRGRPDDVWVSKWANKGVDKLDPFFNWLCGYEQW